MSLEAATAGYALGNGDGEALWFSGQLVTYKTTGDQSNGMLALAEVTAPRGTGSPTHRHRDEDEAWYVIEGELMFWLGDERLTAGPGSFVFGPREIPHRFEVTSAEARFLLIVTPAGFEHFTRVCGDPATSLTMPPPDLPAKEAQQLAAAASAHGLEILDAKMGTT